MMRYWYFLLGFLHSTFGSFHWSPPTWLRTSWTWLNQTAFLRWCKAHPKHSAAAVVLLIGAAVGGLWFKSYWDSRPQPDLTRVSVRRPAITDAEKKVIQPLRIDFSNSVARMEDLDKPLEKYISLSPAMKGTWRWYSASALEFMPSGDDWAVGQKYEIALGQKLLAPGIKLEDYDVDFTMPPMSVRITNVEFHIDPKNPQVKKALATLTFNYPVNIEDVKKRIKLKYSSADNSVLGKGSQDKPFTIGFNKFFTQAYIESENLPIPKENHVMKFSVEKGVRAQRAGEPTDSEVSQEVSVPGLYEGFKLENAQVIYARNDRYEPEQVLMITSSSQAASEAVTEKLKIYLLPKDHQPPGEQKVAKNYRWRSASEVTPEILKESTEITGQLIPTEDPVSTVHSVKLKTEVRRSLYITIEKGVKGLGGYELKERYENVVRVDDYPKELMFMSEGSIISLSGDRKLPLLARNLSEVKVTISRVIPEQANHVIQRMQSEGFKQPYLSQLQDMVTEKFEEKKKLNLESAVATQYFSVDLEPYLNRQASQKGLFLVRVESKDGTSDQRLIMVTDMGVVAKMTVSGKIEVFVQNFATGLPVEGASVEVVGKNGISVLKVPTGPGGQASLPNLKDYKNEKSPVAIVVRRGTDISYLPYKAYDRELSYSRFDVGGIYENSRSDQLMAMLFSDRGIYRPGEEVHIGLMVRSKQLKKLVSKIPLKWSVMDSRGQEILQEKLEVSSADFKSLSFSTQESSATGNYDIRVYVTKKDKRDEQIATLSVRVEEFLPDQMRITSGLSKEKVEGWIAPTEITAHVSLQNLFGTPAENRVVRGTFTLIPVPPRIKAFPDYVFANPNRKDAQNYSEALPEGRTDAQGQASFTLDLRKYEGLFRLKFDAEGFQSEGGRSVTASSTVLVSNLPFLVGHKASGELNYLHKDAQAQVHLIAVDDNHKKRAGEVVLKLIERKYVSSLMRQDNGVYKYQSVKKEIPLQEEKLTISEKGADLVVPTAKAGDFTYLVTTQAGLELNRFDFSVVGEANLSRSLERNAELQLSLNKKDFKPGEEIEMQIKAPYKGAGLITIERDEVYASKWFKTGTSATVERIRIPAGLEGNAYVNVTFLRALDAKEIFTSPLSYAVQPFSISLESFRAHLKVEGPDRARPGDKIKIKYSSDRPVDLILYGVDEGILQVAKYKLPDPLQYFFQKRALQVHSYQLLDLLMPEFSLIDQSPGGDEGFGAAGKNLNPFKRKGQKPVAFWSGVLKADSKVRTFEYEVPDYFNGTMRIMAVSHGTRGLGSEDSSSLVRGDFIITPSAPLFVAPNDEFIMGVSVSNQLEGSGDKAEVQLSVASSEHLQVVGEKEQKIPIGEGREKSVQVRMKALEKLGSAAVDLKSAIGNKSAKAHFELSVRPALTYRTSLEAGVAGKSPIDVKLERQLRPEFHKQSFAVSPAPVALSFALVSYLDGFPYGCTEQLISKAVPSLILRGRPEFAFDIKKAQENFKDTIAMLRTRQTYNGGFALYNVQSEGDQPFVTLYAVHYLTEAKAKGFAVPQDMLSKALGYLRSGSYRKTESLSQTRMFAYALYLQARNSLVAARDINFLRESLEKRLKGEWEKDVTALYLAGAYEMLKMTEEGRKIISGFKMGESSLTDYDYFIDPFTRDSILIAITARHYPDMLKRFLDTESAENWLKPLKDHQYNTFSSAQAILAMEALLVGAEKTSALKDLVIEEITATGAKPIGTPPGLLANVAVSLDAKSVKASGSWSVPMFYGLSQAGFDKEFPKDVLKNKIEVSREYFVKDQKVNKLKLGEEATVHVRLRSMSKDTHRNVAVVDLLPGGFEVVLDSHSGPGSSTSDPSDMQREEDPPENYEGEGEGDEGAAFRWLDVLMPKAYAQTKTTHLSYLSTDYVDYREDRVVIYATATDELREFTYKIKAVSQGRFVVPPIFAESMYDRSVVARGLKDQIEVE